MSLSNSNGAAPERGLVSVIVCTYNRSASLHDTLETLAVQQTPPETSWELIIVDNNSSDDTRAVVNDFAARHSELSVTCLFEPQQGLSHARNRGVGAARGDLILFTDDDVLPAPDWLRTLADAMRTAACDAGGGYIAPLWETDPPHWLTERFHGFLAIRMDETGPKRVEREEEFPFGANMAFRSRVFARLGAFDPSLGRKGTTLAGGEEIDLFNRVQASGGTVMYFPQARVRHKVEAFRLNKAYFRRWRFQASRNHARLDPMPVHRSLFGVPPFLVRQLFRAVGRAALARFALPADLAFRQEMIVWHFMGMMAGLRDKARHVAAGRESGIRPDR